MTSVDSKISFAPGRRYLLFGTQCEGQVLMLAYSKYSVFPLENDGATLTQPVRDQEMLGRPFVSGILDNRSTKAVLNRVKEVRQQSGVQPAH